MKNKLIAGSLAVAFALSAGAAMAEADGEKVFKKRCGACHSLEDNKIGPALGGVIGRKAGTAEGYSKYKAFDGDTNITWDEALLDEWITNQKKFLKSHKDAGVGKRTSMMVKVKKADERAAIIEYLKSAE